MTVRKSALTAVWVFPDPEFFLFATHHHFVAQLLASLRRRLTFTTACKDSFITPGFPRDPIC